MSNIEQETKIGLEHIRKVYPEKKKKGKPAGERVVLNDISLDIKKGEFFSLLGASGCGKTTLLRIIADLAEPTSGRVTIDGTSRTEARKAHKYGISKAEREKIVDKQLELVSLNGYGDHYPHELSGGMQQRVGIARALALTPDILLMDEPFSALDEFTRQNLHDDLLKIWETTGKTIVFVTHNISEAVFLSDRICVLASGLGEISALIDVDLPRPRTAAVLKTDQYFDLLKKTRESFEVNYDGNI